MNVAVKTVAISIFALLLSASGGFLPLDKDLSWMSPFKWFFHGVVGVLRNEVRAGSVVGFGGSELSALDGVYMVGDAGT